MILQPVIVPVPGGQAVDRKDRMALQRQAARRALTLCAGRSGAADCDWPKDQRGVPVPVGGWHWSISHKPQYAAAVIADGPVGIDIEHICERNPAMMDHIAGEEEWDRLGGKTWPNFFLLWTAKEATVKANSRGIGSLAECRLFEIIDDQTLSLVFREQSWRIKIIRFGEHIAAITDVGAGVDWSVLE
jgi:4'-phosphopantetheinyl transferase